MDTWFCFTFTIILLGFSVTCLAEDIIVYSGQQGETMTIVCPYKHRTDRWKRKLWCKENTTGFCETVVSSYLYRLPRMKTNGSFIILDNTSGGFVTVNITNLQKDDSGVYQCRTIMLGDVNTLQRVLVRVLEDVLLKNDSELDTAQYSISGYGTLSAATSVLGASILLSKILIVGLIYTWWITRKIKNGKPELPSSSTTEEQLYAGMRHEELILSSDHNSGPYYINYVYGGHLGLLGPSNHPAHPEARNPVV